MLIWNPQRQIFIKMYKSMGYVDEKASYTQLI